MELSPVVMYPVLGLVTTVAAAAFVWFCKPGLILHHGMQYMLKKTGCKVKYVTVGKRTYCYAERGTPSEACLSMVLVHGYSSSKDTWVPVLKELPPNIHVIALDMLGHGGTTVPAPGEDISYGAFVAGIKECLSAAGIDRRPFHLVGASMGGMVSALYAAEHPADVAKLSLLCPAISTPEPSKFPSLENFLCFNPTNVDALQSMLNVCAYKKVSLNRQILLGLLQLRRPKAEFYVRLYRDILETVGDPIRLQQLEDKAHHVPMPTQVMWGTEDEIIHPSGAERLRSELPNCARVDMLEECGHSINNENTSLVLQYLLMFRGELQANM